MLRLKKPTVKVNTTPIETKTNLQGVKVNDLSRLKTIEDFEKLNIPVQQMTKELLNKKPTQTWKIKATKLYDGQLKLHYFEGVLENNKFTCQGILHNPEDVDRMDRSGERGYDQAEIYRYNFPVAIKFRASGGVDYLLKIKTEKSWDYDNHSDIFIVKNQTFIFRSAVSEQKDYYYFPFKQATSEEITILISSQIMRNRVNWGSLRFTEIQIDRLPKD